jgi:hypothetical protein
VLFIIRQQVQPAFRQAVMQSQQPWIMSQHALSPLVQVITHPSLVISTLHIPIVRLQQHTIIPFIMQHMPHIPPAIIVQRFCIMARAAGSVHTHVTFIPSLHFSILNVQRGTMTMFGAIGPVIIPGIVAVVMPIPMPVIPLVGLSIITVPVMFLLLGSRDCETQG